MGKKCKEKRKAEAHEEAEAVVRAGASAGSDYEKGEADPKKHKKQKKQKKKPTEAATEEKAGSDSEAESKKQKKAVPKDQKKKPNEEVPATEGKDGSKLPDVSWLFDDIDNHKEFFERLLPDYKRSAALKGLIDMNLRNFQDYCSVPDTNIILRKVRYMSENLHLIKMARELHQRIIEPFKGLNAQEALDCLSNPSASMKLALPSTTKSRHSPTQTFTYMGRREFPRLLQKIKERDYVNFTGHSGRGKSYLVAAMACYLHTYETECGVAVYILMSKLVAKFEYLLQALLLAYVRDPTKQLELLARSISEKTLLDFFEDMDDDDKPLFFIDEVDVLDNNTETATSTARNWLDLRGVTCASEKLKSRRTRLKDGLSIKLNRPFDIDELSGWISANGHFKERLGDLINYTGLIPRHLSSYVSDKENFKDSMEYQMQEFMDNIGDKEDLVRRVLDGDLRKIENLALDRSLFYERPFGSKWTIVTVVPFLDTKLRAEMDMRRVIADRKLQIKNFEKRMATFRDIMYDQTDQTAKGLQSVGSLNGCLAECLTREYMLLHGKCLGWQFASSATYEDDHLVTNLEVLAAETLEGGVLFLPTSTNVKYADLHHVQKVGNILKVRAVQISVSSLLSKTYKDSHNLWNKNSKKYWTRDGCETKATFTYILSNALRQSFGDIDAEFTEVKRFVDVDPSLEFIDKLCDPECELLTPTEQWVKCCGQ